MSGPPFFLRRDSVTPFGFTGQYTNVESGLLYMRARYYDPRTQQFISRDPIGGTGGTLQPYAYAKRNPVNYVDPSGALPIGEGEEEEEEGAAAPVLIGGQVLGIGRTGGTAEAVEAAEAEEAKLTLTYKPSMLRSSFNRKVAQLQELAERGLLRVTKGTKSIRDPEVAKEWKRDVQGRIEQQYAHNPGFRNSAISRLWDWTNVQADHIHDLQLGGQDVPENLGLLDANTNWELGTQQIYQQIRNLPEGTLITGIIVNP